MDNQHSTGLTDQPTDQQALIKPKIKNNIALFIKLIK